MITTICRVLGLPSPQVLAFYAIGFVIACGVAFTTGWTVNGWRYDASLADQKSEAATLLINKTNEAANTERDNQIKVNGLEEKHALQQEANRQLEGKNRELADRLNTVLGQLQQPRRREDSGGAVSSCAASGRYIDHLQETNAKLSAAVGELAREGNDLARDADREAGVASTGVDFALEVVSQQPQEVKEGSGE